MTEANYDEVICPNCVTQFRAIPVNVQNEIAALKADRDEYAACADTMAAAHKVERDALKDAARLALDALEIIGSQRVQMQSGRIKDAIAALKAVL